MKAITKQELDFVRFLKSQNTRQSYQTTLVSEAVLKRDWLRPEEDEAWKAL